jgi:type IV secretory pathway VirB2 component (pilin)
MHTNIHPQEAIDRLWRGFLAITLTFATTLLPLEVLATGGGTGTLGANSALDNLFCNFLSWIDGPIGKALATLAIVIVGIGALMGKISWGMAMIVGIGVALIFGAASIVVALGGNKGSQACNTGSSGMGASNTGSIG